MSLFSILDLESEVQLNDKTRFDASKSFWSKDSLPVNSLTIKAGLDGSDIDCFSPNQRDWNLDWAFSTFAIDVDSTNASLIFNEGGSDITATVAGGTYTQAQYATQVQTKMNLVGGQTYTVSYSSVTNKFTVSAAAQFQFKASPVQGQSFFKLDVINTSHTSDIVEYGKRIITVTSGNANAESSVKYFYQNVYSQYGDYLFSGDGDIMAHEPEIMKWVVDGRSSFLNIHRKAQKLIMNWIDEKGWVNTYGKKFTKKDLIDIQEANVWASYMVLRLIFQGLSNSVDDVFDRNANVYSELEETARQRVILRLDVDKDGKADQGEGLSIYSGDLTRR